MILVNQLPQWIRENATDGILDALRKTYYHNTIYDWTVSLLIVLGSVVVARAFYLIAKRFGRKLTARTKSDLDDLFLDKFEEPLVLGLVIVGLFWGVDRLDFPDTAHAFIRNTFHVLIAIDITWFIARMVDALIVRYIMPRVEKSETDFDDQLMPLIRKGLRTIIWILGIIVGLNNAGYNVSALLAGLGIGGLAMAMAAKAFCTL